MQDSRGSEKLLKHLGVRTFDERQLEHFVKELSRADIKIMDWFPHGQPPHPDVLHSRFRVPAKSLGKAIQHLADIEGVLIRDLDIFPLGQPPMIDEFIIDGAFVPGFRG